MKKLILLLILALVIPNIIALTVRQHNCIDLKHPVRIDDFPDSSIMCNITIMDPNNDEVVDFTPMTNDYDEHNYTFCNTSILGTYLYDITCTTGASNKTESFDFEVNTTGREQTSILENVPLLVFGIFALTLVILGISLKNEYFGFIGSIMFLLGGVYTMIYGFNNTADFYTRGVAITMLGLGIVFMFTSAYEWIWND